MTTIVNRQEQVYQGRVFTMVRENVTLDNGVTVDIDTIQHPGASAIVPITAEETVILIRQYRHAVGGYIWEIPAGTLDPGEDPAACAARELVEETGYAAASWRRLGEITPVPGYSDERIHLYLATDLTPASQHLDADEVLDVHEISFETALKMIDAGDIQDAKTICALLRVRCLSERVFAP
jgi:ADP-ribose pyrophosphatase